MNCFLAGVGQRHSPARQYTRAAHFQTLATLKNRNQNLVFCSLNFGFKLKQGFIAQIRLPKLVRCERVGFLNW